MKKKHILKFIHEGKYAMELEIELIETEDEWSPYLSLQDAYRLDDARQALQDGDLKTASKFGRVFELTPVMAGCI